MIQVQPLQNPGSISNVGTLPSPAPLSVTQPAEQHLDYEGTADNPTAQIAPLPLDVKQKMIDKLTSARSQYPGADDQILSQLVEQNKDKYPTQMSKIQAVMGDIGKVKGNSRTERNNNPTAMTSDVAASLGLQNGVDYTQGDPFTTSTGQTLYTAKLNGSDPISATVQAFDKAAANGVNIFTTASGKPRWSYINLTNNQWDSMTPDQKKQTVEHMQNVENGPGGSAQPSYTPSQILDELINQNKPSTGQNQQTYDGSDIPNSTPPGTAALEQTGEFIKNGLLSPIHMADFAAKGLASGIQSIKSAAQAATGNWQGAAQTQSSPLNTPFGAIPTLGSSTTGQNLGSALQAGAAGAGLSSTLPAIVDNKIAGAAISGAGQGLLGGLGGFMASGNRPDLKTSQGIGGALEAAGQGALTGAATGAGAATISPVVTGESNLTDLFKNKQDQALNEKVWQMVKNPDLEPNTNKTTLTGTQATVEPTTIHDQQLIEAAKPYVTNDPIETKSNLQNGIATQSQELENGLTGKGGTWSETNLQGVLNDTKVPLALKNTAEMTVVRNVNNYVMELANDPVITRDAAGSLKLSKLFRQQISTEYGENIWDKDTPAAQYIRNVNQALNRLTESRLPEGNLSNGTPFKQAMRQISLLSEARDNVEIPKEGKQTSTNLLGKGLKLVKPIVRQGAGYLGAGEIVKHLLP